jgi:hypothetical protein
MSIVTTEVTHERAPKRQHIPFHERIVCSVKDAVDVTSLSQSKLYKLMAAGRIEFRMQGRRRMILVQSLLRMLDIGPDAP